MFEQVKSLCDSFLDMGVPGFDLMVYKDGQQVLRYMGGFSDLENKCPVQGNEHYNIYSCSKPITCTAILQLWEKGMFSLDDRLSDYMPEFAEMTVQTDHGVRKADNPIRIHHLFEMTAGFSYDLHSPHLEALRVDTQGRCPTREAMKYLAKEPLLFEPGDQYRYSLCHDVLAALVEVLSGQRFEDYVKKNIFDPLGMKASTFLLPVEQLDTVAAHYRFNAETGKPELRSKMPAYRLGSQYAAGGAGCVSTVEDYIKFAEALRIGDIVLGKDTIRLMATDRLTDHQKRTYTLSTYGYGLGVRTPKVGSARTDFGWGGAAGAYLAVDIPNGISLFYAQHLLTSPNQGIRSRVYTQVLQAVCGKETAPEGPVPVNYNLTY